MLGRGIQCLNHAGTHSRFSITDEVSLGRRRLHSAFWRHGGNNICLSPPLSTHSLSNLFEPEDTTNLDSDWRTSLHRLPSYSLFHLLPAHQDYGFWSRGFLTSNWRLWRANVPLCNVSESLRAFVSYSGNCRANGAPLENVRNQVNGASGIIQDAYPETHSSDAAQELQTLIIAFKDGEPEPALSHAWRLYSSLETHHKTPGLVNAMVELLASSNRPTIIRHKDIHRAILLFDSLPAYDRQPTIYAALLPPLIKNDKLAKAVAIVEEALKSRVSPRIAGAEILLSYSMVNRLWQVLLQVWSACVESFNDEALKTQWKESFFQEASSRPEYSDRIRSLMRAIEAFPNSISPEVDKDFVSKSVDSTFASGSQFGAEYNWRICDTLHQLGLLTDRIFHVAIYRTLADTNCPERTRVYYAFETYRNPPKDYTPSKNILRRLLNYASRVRHASAIRRVYEDWTRLYGQPLGNLANLFMKSFAQLGEKQTVDRLLQQAVASGCSTEDLNPYYPALHVRALMANPSDVKEQMKWMESRGIKLDISCWNILMNAYQRDEDLTGAVDCMAQILDADLSPDSYTIGTLIAIAADRGDTGLTKQLFEASKTLKLPRKQFMNDCMVLSLLNNNSWQEAEGLAISMTKASEAKDCTFMWNQVLTYHALRPPPAGLTDAFRVARAMSQLQVPFDSMTYAAMMRAHTISRRPDEAEEILFKVMPRKSVSLTAFHFAIVIEGYTAQLALEQGIRLHAEMLRRDIKPDISSKVALLNLQIAAVRNRVSIARAYLPGIRADVPEELFEDILKSENPLATLYKKPWLGSSQFKAMEASPAAYFNCLLSFYGSVRAYDVIKSLLSRYRREYGPRYPLRLLSTVMGNHYRQREYEEVEWYWNLAKESAVNAAMTGDRLAQGDKAPWLSSGRRTVLARHLNFLLRSLSGRGSADRMREEISKFHLAGFELDNRNWNLYVQLLASGGHVLEAFETCESMLTPSFDGWRRRNEATARKQRLRVKSYGMQYRGHDTPGFYFARTGIFEVEYATVVRLFGALRKLRVQAPFDSAAKNLAAQIASTAPKTTRIVVDMPRFKSEFTRHLLAPSLIRHWKRGRGRLGRKFTRAQINMRRGLGPKPRPDLLREGSDEAVTASESMK